MGKRGGYHGESPADRSINAMDKFIRKSERVQQSNERNGKKISVEDLERKSLKEQLDYYNNRTEADIFDEKYPAYSYWYDDVKKRSGVHPRTFSDWTAKYRPMLQEMYTKKVPVRDTVSELKKLGIY
jgi:hypothetical protein